MQGGYPPPGGYGGPPPGPPQGPPGGYGPPPGPPAGGYGQPPQPPPGFAPPGGFPGAPGLGGGAASAQSKVGAPGIALLVVGILALLTHLAMGVLQLLGGGLSALGGGSSAMGGILGGVIGGVVYIVLALLQGVVIFGGLKMKNLQSWGLAVAAAVIALLPCTNGWCCLIGLPVGIWALVVLMNNDVKAAFRG